MLARISLAISIVWAVSVAGTPARAAEDAILVLDASGSMWGRLEGEEKIVVARRVINELLGDLPADRRLGLVAYGHNRKGDCGDIEELAAVGTARADISAAMAKLNPKGKTPLSASVKFAAEKLRYTENKATVILVSDGEETCDVDPCALGTELEQLGVDFTTHVIGFDIGQEQHRTQLQCLAENTGGRYLSASNAAELASALEETVVKAPEPVRTTGVVLRATELSGGPLIESGLEWTVQQAGGGAVLFEASDAGVAEAELPPGAYDIFVARPADGLKGDTRGVALRPGANKTVTIALEFALEASVRTIPEGAAPVSSEIIVYWEGPDRQSDYVTITPPDASPSAYRDYEYTRQGNPLKLRLPVDEGAYEVRYVLGRPARVLARVPITAEATEATLTAPETVAAGAEFQVAWTGPGYNDDWLTIVKPDAGERAYLDYEYTRQGNPAKLKAPLEAGDYELRYVQAGAKVVARRAIQVSAVEATVTGPETAMAGTRHDVEWTGPGGQGDWLTVTQPGAGERSYTDYDYMRKGSPLRLRVPLEPGTYEWRYVQGGQKVIARQTLKVTPAEATLDAPDTAAVGATVSVGWTGPGEQRDFITVTRPDIAENGYTDYEYARNGSPASINMPLEPGAYEVRYVLDSAKVVARRAITVTDVEVSISGPPSIAAGGTFNAQWTGPAYRRDFITIVAPGAAANAYTNYKYARRGSPSELTAPDEPGTYELRYVLGGRRVIARQTVEVTAE
ncbi:MAG: VWA domain-containing protein [Sphingomonadales bacterium]|nr:VWA domain-containing protein [Sphingomonadales bacterium]